MDRFLEQLAASDNELSILNIYVEEIHRLSAENERLREALQPFALYRGRPYQERGPDHSVVVTVNTLDGLTHRITWGDLRRARAALEEPTDG